MRSFKAAVIILMIAVVVPIQPARAAMVPVGEIGFGLSRVVAGTQNGVVRLSPEWNASSGPGIEPSLGGDVVTGPGRSGSGDADPSQQGSLWQNPPHSMVIDHTPQQLLLTRNIVAQGVITPVPEPATLILMGLGIAGLGVASRLRRLG